MIAEREREREATSPRVQQLQQVPPSECYLIIVRFFVVVVVKIRHNKKRIHSRNSVRGCCAPRDIGFLERLFEWSVNSGLSIANGRVHSGWQ